jgi:hypothetical protein
MKTLLSFALLTVMVSMVGGCAKKRTPSSQERLGKEFEQMMAGATLVGHSTMTNREGISGEERYSIDAISKIGSETWLIRTRMKLGSHEIPFPIPIVIKWAGDTPVIALKREGRNLHTRRCDNRKWQGTRNFAL